MKIQHTEGNWTFSKYSPIDFGVHSDKGDGRDIALVRGDSEEAEANAKLIAAAPQLLAAIKRFQDEWIVNGTPAQRANNLSIERQMNDAAREATV